MINALWLEVLGKYSFIDKAERNGVYVYLYYTFKGKQKHKKFSTRATSKQILSILNKIRTEMGLSIYGKGHFSDIYITGVD